MDLDEWEILPNENFLDYHEHDHLKPRNHTRSLFKVNHFICPSSPPKRFSGVVPNHVVPLTVQLEPPSSATTSSSEQAPPVAPSDISLLPCVIMPDVKNPITNTPPTTVLDPKEPESDQDSVSSQVFFKKTEQFVDKTQIEVFSGGDPGMEAKMSSPRMKKEEEKGEKWEENGGVWKWSMSGIGAICSFGVAAATICIMIFGSHHRNTLHNHKLRFQIYADDKRMKQVVEKATKMNEAICGVRGVPIQRAHITTGGYYEGL